MGLLLRADGRVTLVTPKNGKSFSLEELQGFVGGFIELVWINQTDLDLYCNEEGKLANLPLNPLATVLYRCRVFTPDVICGDALLCSCAESGGTPDPEGDDPE